MTLSMLKSVSAILTFWTWVRKTLSWACLENCLPFFLPEPWPLTEHARKCAHPLKYVPISVSIDFPNKIHMLLFFAGKHYPHLLQVIFLHSYLLIVIFGFCTCQDCLVTPQLLGSGPQVIQTGLGFSSLCASPVSGLVISILLRPQPPSPCKDPWQLLPIQVVVLWVMKSCSE